MKKIGKRKVLFFDNVPILGGAEQSLLDILRGLDRTAFEPIVLLTSPGPLAERAQSLGIPVDYVRIPAAILKRKRYNINLFSVRTLWDAFRLLPVILRVALVIRRERIDVVHTNTLKTHLIGGLAGRLCGRRVVWHFRDILVRDSLRLWMVRLSYGLSDRVIAISGAVRDQFGPGYPGSRINVIHNSIDGKELRSVAAASDGRSIRREFGLPVNARLVGMVGQIARWKGQEYFIRAAAALARRYPGVYFLIVGDVLFEEWEYKFQMLELVKQLGLERRAIFTGQRSDVYGVLRELSVMTHCSIEPEPFGRVLIEAMALRVPVVATGGGAVDEIIRHGENGLIVPPRDEAALAAAVSAVLDGTVPAGALTERALTAVRERFSPAVMMASIERVLGAQP